MAFTGNAFCTSAKVGFLTGTYTPLTDTMKIALYTNLATLSASTLIYTTVGEIPATGNYITGGNTLAGTAISFAGTTAWLTFNNSTWLTSTFNNVRGALIYDFSKSNAAIAVLDFGSDKTTRGTAFVVQMPLPGATTSILRIT